MKVLIKYIYKGVLQLTTRPKNLKTTIAAIIALVVGVLKVTGLVDIPPDVQTALLTIIVFVIGLLSADASTKRS